MKIKNFSYNYYLKALRELNDLTDTIKPKSKETKVYKELNYINHHIERIYDNEDNFVKANFTTSEGISYTIYAGGEIDEHKDGVTRRLELQTMKVNEGRSNYRAFDVRSTVCDLDKSGKQRIFFHILMMVAAYEEFLETYMSRKNYVVNHTCICDFAENRVNNFDAIWNLELIIQRKNIIHGKFVRKYGLFNIPVEAEDMCILARYLVSTKRLEGTKKERVEKENREKVIRYIESIKIGNLSRRV